MDPFIGEIRAFSFGITPKGWARCQGQLLAINGNQALFSLLGTTYGGNGVTTFALPDLRGRVPMGTGTKDGQPRSQGQRGGLESVTLIASQFPLHTHSVRVTTETGTAAQPSVGGTDNVIAAATTKPTGGTPVPLYAAGTGGRLNPGSVSAAGATQPHQNVQPSTTTNYCIAITGIFPARQ